MLNEIINIQKDVTKRNSELSLISYRKKKKKQKNLTIYWVLYDKLCFKYFTYIILILKIILQGINSHPFYT